MKKIFLFLFVFFSFLVPCHAVTLSHMQYVTLENFPTTSPDEDYTFSVDSNFWFVFRDSSTNNVTLAISSKLITGNYTQKNSTMPIVGDSSIYYTSRQNGYTYVYLYDYNPLTGSWDYSTKQTFWDTKNVEYPASYLYQSSQVDFYNASGEVVFPATLEIWNLPLGMTTVRAEVPAMRGMILTVALCGVGCLALLILLKLFGRPFLQFLRR